MHIILHQGLGDHIICNGLVRAVAKQHEQVFVPALVNTSARDSTSLIKYMYRDNANINVYDVNGDELKELLSISKRKQNQSKYLVVGYDKPRPMASNFDKWFYRSAEIDFQKRFDNFYIERDLSAENDLYNELTGGEEYIFVHDDPSRNLSMDYSLIRKDLKIIKNNLNINFFNYRKIFENATELHLMQSGIYDFTNSIRLTKPKIFLHRYVRRYGDFYNAESLNARKEYP